MYIHYFVMYIYHLRKKLDARLDVDYGFGMFEIFEKTSLSNNEQDYIKYAHNYIYHSYAIILAQFACLFRFGQTRFP